MTTLTTPATSQHTLLTGIQKIASSYLLRRLAKAVFSIWLVTTITFFVIRAMPGNAVQIMDMRGAMSPGIKPAFPLKFIADIFMHVRVLLLVYVLSSIGSWMLQMKSNTVATLGEDYVTVARARGLTDYRILTAYVGRNATLPLFTRLATSVGFVVGGSVLLE